ncbi:BRCA1-associated RING domain protein 1 [Salarias fasciatus]|uniref:BRCA1-associated RING domain protein 1 n=1 Tax=Salarias fasciatus TaxID=181472 RepID=UPI001176660C|nr:BRCA1-associated RING domain protein 1 [Salarias fasciatus]
MDADSSVQTNDWKNTRESVANFRRLLLCSKCSNFMKEPVCLGLCEHMLCRSCAGPRAGDGCAVCRSPAWVKDIQINRQLSTIVELFGGLESLLNPAKQPDSPVDDIQPQPESHVFKQRKNFKIWFSPRSRKVRCMLEKPSDVTAADGAPPGETAAARPGAPTAQNQDLSVFNFTPSSQESASSPSPQRCSGNKNVKKRSAARRAQTTTRKQTRQNVQKKRLKAINEQWGVMQEARDTSEEKQDCADGARRSSKRVSFLSPAVASDESRPQVPQGSTNELSPARSTPGESVPERGVGAALNDQAQPNHSVSNGIAQQAKLPANDPDPEGSAQKPGSSSPSARSAKRSRAGAELSPSEGTPKRPRASPGRWRKSLGRMFPADPRSPVDSAGGSPAATESRRRSPGSPRGSARRPNAGSPLTRRNHKGETPLHLAAIKGDAEAVKELLEQGADPNLRDHAGWTPLHEACNLGHVAIVEILVSKGALLNTPGYENDSPLHDAVRNGHPAVVKLLLQLGASQSVLNLHGKRPADYAAGPEMQQIFQEVSEGARDAHASHSPSASLSETGDGSRMDQATVLLATKLSAREQQQLARLGLLLGGTTAHTFSGSVSHVVVPEGQMPTTFSALQGILGGCWVVRYSWVEACLQAGEWVPEAEHEAGDGARRSRINRCSLLPPLFDGCFFFLLGSFKAPSRDELAALLREGGGQLLSRQPKPDSDVTQTLSAAAYHALPGSDQTLCTQYIIFDPRGPHRPPAVRRGKVWSAPFTWLIECVAAFALLPVPDPQI